MDQHKNNYLIKDWKLPKSIESGYTSNDNKTLSRCSKLNVLIGPNNSGKSLLLRALFYEEEMHFMPANVDLNILAEEIEKKNKELSQIFNRGAVAKFGSRTNLNNIIPTPEQVIEKIDWLAETTEVIQSLRGSTALNIDSGRRAIIDKDTLRVKLNFIASQLDKYIQSLNILPKYKFKKIYIPSIRSLRKIGNTDNSFRERIIEDYFSKGRIANRDHMGMVQNPGPDIITGMELYTFVRSYLLGSLKQREQVRDYEKFISSHFFNGQEVTLIPREDIDNKNILVIKIGNEQERPIHQVGDGIQQIIILTIPIFLFRDQHLLLFLEEPELNMHPGYQRKLIDALLHEPAEKSRQTVITTHSNQFLDMTLDESSVSIFKLEKKLPDGGDQEKVPTFKIIPSTNKDFQLLRDLGIHNSSVMLSNCTIWVEGITDRMYIRHYLKILTKESPTQYMEDLHYSFVEYGGSCITHWSFLDDEEHPIDVESLCGRLILIADSDEGKEERHDKLEKNLKDRFYKIPCREIENLLTPEVITNIIKDYEGNDVELNGFKQEDYKDDSLGSFIDDRVLVNKSKSKRIRKTEGAGCEASKSAYADKSGTIKNKVNFAEKAIKYIVTKDDMSQDAMVLVTKILAFIQKNNP